MGRFPDISKSGVLGDLQSVNKHKSMGPCVQELEPKMRVNLSFFAVTRKMNTCILPSLSHKKKEINVFNVVCQLFDGIEDQNQST